MWREIEAGAEWIVDADLKDYFGSIDHEKLLTLVAQRVADGRVLTLIERMLTAGAISLPAAMITSKARHGGLYAYPTQKSIDRFKDSVRRKTQRRIPLRTAELIRELNPVIRGWGEYYKRAHVRRLFNQLDRWIARRLWSHRYRRWRWAGWQTLPVRRLRGELGLVSLIGRIPSLTPRRVVAPS